LLATKSGGDVELSWQDMGLSPQSYNVYEGEIGAWYSHLAFACHLGPPDAVCGGGRCVKTITPGPLDQYYLITASGPGGEGPAGPGSSWSGPDHVTPPTYVVPSPCAAP
jgi:hypothetical protein